MTRAPPICATERVSPALSRLRSLARLPYEYELDKLAIDVISGSPLLREWLDDPAAAPADLDILARPDEEAWCETCPPFLPY